MLETRANDGPVRKGRVENLRAAAALALYVVAALWLTAGVAIFLAGGLHRDLFGHYVTVTSWQWLRWPCLGVVAAYVVDHQREQRVAWLRQRLAPRWRWVCAGALAGITLNLVWFKVAQHRGFYTNAWDLTEFESAVYFTLHGDPLWAFGIERSLFGDHFEPLLLALVPFYAAAPSPLTLLVAQALCVAAAGVPLYLIGKESGLSRAGASLLTLLFFASPYLWGGFYFDFHIELFAPLFLFCAYLAFLRRRWPYFYLALFGALLVKEDVGLALVSMALLMVLRRRSDWRHALAACFLGVTWTVVAFKLVIPAFDVASKGQRYYAGRYSHLGATHGQVVWSLLDPRRTLGLLTGLPVRNFLASFYYLPLLDPGLCLAVAPPLLIHLASNFADQSQLLIYYPLPAFCVALAGLPLAMKRLARVHPRLGQFVVLMAVCMHPGALWPQAHEPRTDVGRALFATVPKGARIATQNSVAPQLEPSKTVWLFPRDDVDWVVLDLERDHHPLSPAEYGQHIARHLEGTTFGVVAWQEGFLILRRGAPAEGNAAVLDEVRRRL
jgi:uncharacterized membrane protein